MNYHHQKGIALVKLLIIIIIFGAVIGIMFLLLNDEKAKTRDAKRLSDISRLQVAFEFLYNDTASYEQAAQNGCNQINILVSQCNLKNYIPSINQFKDPSQYQYVVSKVPSEDGYEVTFYLEKDYDGLKAGKHILSPLGIN